MAPKDESASQPIIIVGSGLAGYTLAREFRKLNQDSHLSIVTADDGVFYSKPMLSNALTAKKNAAQLAMKTPQQMEQELAATIISETSVSAIYPLKHRIKANQDYLHYSYLVLALGAEPVRLKLPGNASNAIYSVNDRIDYKRFQDAIVGQKHIAIIGDGLIACEFANDLLNQNYQVSIIGPGPKPLNRLLPTPAGDALKQALESIGAKWYLEKSVVSANHQADQISLGLSDGSEVVSDIVLSAVGLRPRTKLAEEAELEINRGIVCNPYMETSDRDIYALGDCAEIAGLNLPFVLPIMNGARTLAKTLAGERTRLTYPAMPIAVKTPALPIIVSPPAADAKGEWTIEHDGQNVKCLFENETGELLGFALTGSCCGEKQALSKLVPMVLA
ncbi:MAG: FAD-dependent oxidoreductase [Gammaproteobacteria bacterium]|nr:FAD-dependent oxidoreductase [Gammaproteobacteria bacterium]